MIKKIYKQLVSEKRRNWIRRSIQSAKAPLYYGDTFQCNCCGKSFRALLPKAKRQNAECPYCGSLERTRLLLHYLKNETGVFSEHLKVLHFAPEPALYKLLKQEDIEYVDGDLHPAYANHIVDITAIPYENDYFDLIICSHVIAHVPDEAKALSELLRVLAPGGKAIILTYINSESEDTIDHEWVNTPALRKEHYGEPDCLRVHGNGFKAILENTGFKVNQIDYRLKLGPELMEKNVLGEGPREWIFECFK